MKGRVLVVDDEESVIRLYQDLLETCGIEVMDVAYDGDEAIAKLNGCENPPDLVIMDHRMPIKNGLETMGEMLRSCPDLKVLFVSADPSICKSAIDNGAVGFIGKPFKIDDFCGAIESVLSNKDEQ